MFGLLALTPLVSVPIVRRMKRKSLASEQQPSAGIEDNFVIWALTEYTHWEVTSMLGFVGFVQGAPPAFLIGCLIVTLIGSQSASPDGHDGASSFKS